MADPLRKNALLRWVESQLSSEQLERIRSLPTRQNEYGYDPFGFHRDQAKSGMLLGWWLYRYYFRVKSTGLENIPSGRVMLVANHSGQLPFDGVNIAAGVLFESPRARLPRAMVERLVPTLPYIGALLSRWGQVLGTPENCKRLLADEEAILVFPEGARGISKPFTKRYQLENFGHGFMRLALATKTPIVPVAVVGAEEQAPALNIKWLAKLLNLPSFPFMPFPPFFPAIPLPSRYHIQYGEPVLFEGDPEDDDEEIETLVKQVRLSIESMIWVGLRQRKSIYL
jgi:1-acyl-sn-glycerol-3-phosphate acyltransferase